MREGGRRGRAGQVAASRTLAKETMEVRGLRFRDDVKGEHGSIMAYG